LPPCRGCRMMVLAGHGPEAMRRSWSSWAHGFFQTAGIAARPTRLFSTADCVRALTALLSSPRAPVLALPSGFVIPLPPGLTPAAGARPPVLTDHPRARSAPWFGSAMWMAGTSLHCRPLPPSASRTPAAIPAPPGLCLPGAGPSCPPSPQDRSTAAAPPRRPHECRDPRARPADPPVRGGPTPSVSYIRPLRLSPAAPPPGTRRHPAMHTPCPQLQECQPSAHGPPTVTPGLRPQPGPLSPGAFCRQDTLGPRATLRHAPYPALGLSPPP